MMVMGAAERCLDYEDTVREIGYASLPIALKALGQTKRGHAQLPEEFRIHPAQWEQETTTEKVYAWGGSGMTSRNYKVAAVTPLQAAAKHRRLEPVLRDVIEQAIENDCLDQVLHAYKTESYEEFVRLCFDYLRGSDDVEDQDPAHAVPAAVAEELQGLRASAEAAGEDFDEEAALCLLSTGVYWPVPWHQDDYSSGRSSEHRHQ